MRAKKPDKAIGPQVRQKPGPQNSLGFVKFLFANCNANRVIIRLAVAAAQYYMPVRVATGMDNRHLAFDIDAKKTVWFGY